MRRNPLAAALILGIALTGCAEGDGTVPGGDDGADGVGVAYYENGSNDHDTHGGHQWMVLQALEILGVDAGGDYSLARARDIVSMMRRPDCEAGWLAGIYEADEKSQYTGNLWEYHFYGVADGGLSYTGSTTTAKTMALQYLNSGMAKVRAGNYAGGCYDLGISLHFVTDIAQPMHVANFTAGDWPYGLHSRWEQYVEETQESYEIAHWNGVQPFSLPMQQGDAELVIESLAWSSYLQWEQSMEDVLKDYNLFWCNWKWSPWSACWNDMVAVHRESRAAVYRGQIQTASFMYTAFGD